MDSGGAKGSSSFLPFQGSRNQVRSHDVKELARRDDLGLLPEFRKMLLIAGYEVIGPRRIRAFEELIIVQVFRHQERAGRLDEVSLAPYEFEKLLAKPLANLEFRPRQDLAVFVENRLGNVQGRRLRSSKEQNGPRDPARIEGSRDQDVGIDD